MRWQRALAAALLALAACDDGPSAPPASGRLQVDVMGLPAGVLGKVTVRGPKSFARDVAQSTVLTGLMSGDYELWSSPVFTDSTTYAPTDTLLRVAVDQTTTASASPSYRLVTGRLAVLLEGLPPGSAGRVTVDGPDRFSATLTASDTLVQLVPGEYQISVSSVTIGADVYSPSTTSTTSTVSAEIDPATVRLRYRLISGAVHVTVTGLPSTIPGAVRLTGPNGVIQTITASRTIGGLLGGVYTLDADTVRSGSAAWAPVPATQLFTLSTGSDAAATLNYVPLSPSSAPNLFIAGAHVQQVVQSFGGSVPLIAGREALLRVFVLGSVAGIPAPEVRARFYNGSTLVSSVIIPPPLASAPTTLDEGSLPSSWNYRLPGALLQPGLELLVDVDPSNVVSESSETDNAWPSATDPLPLIVRAVAPLSVRLIPVNHAASGLVGRVSSANADQFLDAARRLLPMSTINGVVAPPFTTNAPELVPSDSNGAWLQILSEINALRAAEGGTSLYYGVVQPPYRSGIVGLSYVKGRAAVGADFLPGASVVVAHEIGHSLGRFHAPCGGAAGVDVSYPYARAAIGAWGWDAVTGGLVAPTASDVMSYCTPVWISDYTFGGMLDHWLVYGPQAAVPSAAEQPGLLVWGRIERGHPVLEPAFDVVAPPYQPRPGGPDRLDLLGEGGRVLISLPFQAERVGDANDSTAAHFAFVIPRAAIGGELRAIQLRSRGRTSRLDASAPPSTTAPGRSGGSPLASVTARRLAAGRVRVTIAGGQSTATLVRDRASGRILGILHRGQATLPVTDNSLEVIVSDGVRSTRQLLGIPGARGDTTPPRRR